MAESLDAYRWRAIAERLDASAEALAANLERMQHERDEALTEVKRLREQVEYIDYCLDKWNHGAPAALREYWAERAEALDGVGSDG